MLCERVRLRMKAARHPNHTGKLDMIKLTFTALENMCMKLRNPFVNVKHDGNAYSVAEYRDYRLCRRLRFFFFNKGNTQMLSKCRDVSLVDVAANVFGVLKSFQLEGNQRTRLTQWH